MDYIACFIVSFLTIFSIFVSFKKIINEEPKFNLKNILILNLGSLITTFVYYLDQSIIKTISTLIFFIIIFKINSTKSFKELFYYALILWIYGILTDLIIMIVLSVTGLLELLNSVNIIYVRIGSGFVLAILLILFCSISYIKKFTNKTVEKLIKINPSIIMDIMLILSLIFLSVICVANVSKKSVTLFSVFIALLILVLIYMVLNKNYNINRLKEVNSILIKNNEFFIKLDSDYRILKHNLVHQLVGIKSVSNNQAKKLIDDLISKYNSNFAVPKDINKIPNGINGLIYEKFYLYDCKDLKIAVDNMIENELIDVIKPKTFNNLCETLGVLIDNAIEAAKDSKEKTILIDFTEDRNNIILKITNTFDNKLDIDKLGEKSYSTKGELHGIGLFSIFKNNDIKTRTRIINNLFQVELKIKKILY